MPEKAGWIVRITEDRNTIGASRRSTLRRAERRDAPLGSVAAEADARGVARGIRPACRREAKQRAGINGVAGATPVAPARC